MSGYGTSGQIYRDDVLGLKRANMARHRALSIVTLFSLIAICLTIIAWIGASYISPYDHFVNFGGGWGMGVCAGGWWRDNGWMSIVYIAHYPHAGWWSDRFFQVPIILPAISFLILPLIWGLGRIRRNRPGFSICKAVKEQEKGTSLIIGADQSGRESLPLKTFAPPYPPRWR